MVLGFRCPFFPDMPSSTDPGDFDTDRSRTTMSTWPSPRGQRLGIPKFPQSVSRGATFRGFHSSHTRYGLPVCSSPCTDPTSFPAVGDFYSQAFSGIGSLLGMTTAVAGPLCWRDLHPLERQLASLHQHSPPSGPLRLTWAGLSPAGSHQLAAGAFAVGTRVTSRPPGRAGRSPASRSHRT